MADTDAKSQHLSIGRLYEIAFGWLGMTNAEFETTTLFQFNCRLKGYQEAKETESRERWEQTRLLIDGIWRTVSWKNNQTPNVREMYPMPWDPKPQAPPKISEYDQAVKDYKFKLRFPHLSFNRDKEAAIKKYLPELEKEFGKINERVEPAADRED